MTSIKEKAAIRAEAFRVGRYGLSGVFVNLLAIAIYQLALWLMPPESSYLLAVVCGGLVSYWMQSRLVFRSRPRRKQVGLFLTVYALNIVLGMAALSFLVRVLDIHPRLAPFIVLVVLVPIVYLINRRILMPTSPGHASSGLS